MNPLDHQLDRLLRAAARAPREPIVATLPFGAHTRILSTWRVSQADSAGWLASWLQAGLAAAALAAAVALGLSWSNFQAPVGDEYAVANAALYVAVAP